MSDVQVFYYTGPPSWALELAGDASGIPVDPRLWLEGPPSSPYPACIAVKAAAEQA